jgi:hypothetical protein
MFQKQNAASSLNSEIERVLSKMEAEDPDSESYAEMLATLVKLHALKVAETPKPVSRDTLALIAANLFGIILVLQHEKTTIIPKAAMTFVKKAW